MKDIKLTIEDIKKGCEFSYGFEVKGNMLVCGSESFHSTDFPEGLKIIPEFVNVYYPLFLSKIIEGINKSKKIHYAININYQVYTVMRTFIKSSVDCDDYPLTDEGLEQAIKYILDKL